MAGEKRVKRNHVGDGIGRVTKAFARCIDGRNQVTYLLTTSQVIFNSLQTGIGQLNEEQRFVFARSLLGHKAIVLVRRQTVLHPSGQCGHRGGYSVGAITFDRTLCSCREEFFLIFFYLLQTNHNAIAMVADMYA